MNETSPDNETVDLDPGVWGVHSSQAVTAPSPDDPRSPDGKAGGRRSIVRPILIWALIGALTAFVWVLFAQLRLARADQALARAVKEGDGRAAARALATGANPDLALNEGTGDGRGLLERLRMYFRGQPAPPPRGSRLCLMYAASHGKLEVVRALQDHSARRGTSQDDVDKELASAINDGDPGRVECLVAVGGDPNRRGMRFGSPPIVQAVNRQRADLVRILLKYGGNPNFSTHRATVLGLAIANGDRGTVGALLDAGADLTRPAFDGLSPLSLAERGRNRDILHQLVQAAEERGRRDPKGRTYTD